MYVCLYMQISTCASGRTPLPGILTKTNANNGKTMNNPEIRCGKWRGLGRRRRKSPSGKIIIIIRWERGESEISSRIVIIRGRESGLPRRARGVICSPSQQVAGRDKLRHSNSRLARLRSPEMPRAMCASRLGEGLATGGVSPVCGVGVWWFQVCSRQAANVDFERGDTCCRTTSIGE